MRVNPTDVITNKRKLGSCVFEQTVLADATIFTWIAPATGRITGSKQFVGTHCTGAGNAQTTAIDVKKGGVSCLVAAALINEVADTTVVSGTPAGGGVADFVAGSVITVVNDYTADGGGANTGAALKGVFYYEID